MAIPVAAAGGAGDDSGDRIREVQAVLLRIGRMRFGSLDPEIERRIRAIQELKQLKKLLNRLGEVASLQDLFPSE